MKICSRCKLAKDLDEFYNSSKSSDGKGGYCKDCVREYGRENAEAKAAASVKWYSNGGARKIRDRRLRQQYGITIEQYEQMRDEQNGVCAICNEPEIDGTDLSLDHDHETGLVRKLLCRSCNLMIKRESPTLLELGAEYLRQYGKEVQSQSCLLFILQHCQPEPSFQQNVPRKQSISSSE